MAYFHLHSQPVGLPHCKEKARHESYMHIPGPLEGMHDDPNIASNEHLFIGNMFDQVFKVPNE